MDSRLWRDRCRNQRGMSLLETLLVVGIFSVVAAIAIPVGPTAVRGYKLAGHGQAIAYQVSLAKMRAAASFTRARVYIDFAVNTYRLEVWNAAAATWTTDGSVEQLVQPIGFGFGNALAPPPDTQGAIAQPDPCRDAGGAVIANSGCVMFNSRGIPIDSTGAATGANGVYLTDGTAVYATTVSATGMTQLWWTPNNVISWVRH
jgi:prepilin-type N-terminal cleavage/methylation domain-containing protein